MKWIICKDVDLPSNVRSRRINNTSLNPNYLLNKKFELAQPKLPFRFACTDYKKNTVYIAEEAIILNYRNYASYAEAFLRSRSEKNELPYIIMDELVHIKTGLDHGDEVYDKQLYKYIQLYNQ